MKTGTKSVLFGAHCFFLHPFFVFAAWWKLYGFPYDPRLWVAFFVHDLGYIGKPNMDGPEGELHPYIGALIMNKLFDKLKVKKIYENGSVNYKTPSYPYRAMANEHGGICRSNGDYWFLFTLYHSRFLARKNDAHFSKLCVADKYAICLTPTWLYVPMALASGEIHEYIKDAEKNSNGTVKSGTYTNWHKSVKKYVAGWVEEHKDMRPDTWTPANRTAIDKNGVWK